MRITVIFGRFGRADQSSSVLMDADHGGGDSGCWLCFTALFSSSALSGRKPLPHIFFLLPRVLLGALLTHCGSFRMRPPSSLPPPPPSLQSKALPTSQPSSTVKPCQLHSWYYHRLSSAKNEMFSPETRSLVDLNIVLKCFR